MSTKRILAISAFALLFIAIIIITMLVLLYFNSEVKTVQLPDVTTSPVETNQTEPDALSRVELTRETVQVGVSTLTRPEVYSRTVYISTYWEDGRSDSVIQVSVHGGATSLRIRVASGREKRIIVTSDALYIWYLGDRIPYIGAINSTGDGLRTADEWQMLITYEDIMELDVGDITDAGYMEYNGMDCIFAEYRSPLLGYTARFYVSLELGLVVGAEEYDTDGTLIYTMTTGECTIGEVNANEFSLPDGTIISAGQ